MKSNAKQVMAKINKRLKAIVDDAPVILGDAGTKLFVSSFSKQGYGDDTVQKWAKRKKETKKTEGKPILVGTGRLRRAVNGSLKILGKGKLVWRVYLPYAQIQNEGGVIQKKASYKDMYFTESGKFAKSRRKKDKKSAFDSKSVHFKKHSIRIPARPFMVGGFVLKRILLKKYNQMIKSALSKR